MRTIAYSGALLSSTMYSWSLPLLLYIEEAIRFFLSEDSSPISTKLGDNLPNQEGLGRLLLSSKGLAKLLAGVSANKKLVKPSRTSGRGLPTFLKPPI